MRLPHFAKFDEKELMHIAIFHAPIKIIQRSKGRSAVATAAYRSGTKLTNGWDGLTYDYTKKRDIVHSEIMLPAHAPPEFADRSTLWNSVELNEKAKDSQLAREIEVALPVELSRDEQLKLIRAYVRDTFVNAGMCADFALHDKGDGNPHAHIMLTIRPLTPSGQWGAKCRKVYDLDDHGQRIPDVKGGWKNHREDTTDWNDHGKAEVWRAVWADYANHALEANGRPERIDHRSYKRQGIDKIPTIHMGAAATRMEQRGIQTYKGDINRQIDADNKLLKEIRARITRLCNWAKENAEPSPERERVIDKLVQAQFALNQNASRCGKVKKVKQNAALINFLTENGIESMHQLYERVASMNKAYYELRGQIASAERQLTALHENLEMWARYEKIKPVRQQLDGMKPKLQDQFKMQHCADLILFEAAYQHLKKLKDGGEHITPKRWRAETEKLTVKKDGMYKQMKTMRDEIAVVEDLKRAAEQLVKAEQTRKHEQEV